MRREPAIAGMVGGVRYQVYASTDGHVLFMASEQHFWKKFCEAVGRPELFERWPGSEYGDHARGNRELQAELTPIFGSKSTAEWVQFGIDVDVPIAPCHTPKTVADDPQFADRFEWFPTEALGAEQLPFPVKIVGADPVVPGKAPELGRAHRRRARRRARATTPTASPRCAPPARSADRGLASTGASGGRGDRRRCGGGRAARRVTPMSGSATGPRAAPAPGQAPLVAPNAAALLRRNAADPDIGPRPAIRFGDRVWTHAEYFAESCRLGEPVPRAAARGPARATSRCCSTTRPTTCSRSAARR